MKPLLPILALILSLTALIVASVSGGGSSSSAPASTEEAAEVTQELDEELVAVRRRTEYLEDTVARLAARLTALEHRPGGAGAPGRDGGPPSQAELTSAVRETLGLQGGAPVAGAIPDAERDQLKETVKAVQLEIREDERRAFVERWAQAQTEGAPERRTKWKQFATDARLNGGQESEILRRVDAEEQLRQSISEQVKEGIKSTREAQREIRQLRSNNDQEMEKLLTPEQLASYKQVRREENRESRRTMRFDGPAGMDMGGRRRRE